MDSRRWLAALGALGALLAVALALDAARRPHAPSGRRVVPDFDLRAVRSVRIERRGGDPIAIEGRDGAWRMTQPAQAPIDPAAMADLLGTVEMLAAQRRDGSALADPALHIVIEREGGGAVDLSLAAPEGATDRVWASRAGTPGRFLIDGYAARALDVAAEDLRDTRPFRGRLRDVRRIEISAGGASVVLTGPSWKVGAARADAARVSELIDQLSQLRIDPAGAGAPTGSAPAAGIVVEAASGAAELVVRGACAGGGAAVISSPVGPGCLDQASLDALAATTAPAQPLVDRHPWSGPASGVASLRLEGGGRSIEVTRAEKPEELRAWLEEVAAAVTGEVVPMPQGAAALAEIEVVTDGADSASERITAARLAGGTLVLRRAGEPVGLLLAAGDETAALFEPSPVRFHSLELVTADPTDLEVARRMAGRPGAVVESIARGETLEEWRAIAPEGATVDTEAAERLATAVAALRARRVVVDRANGRHGFGAPYRAVEVELGTGPGGAAAVRRTIELGAASRGGCFARIDGDPVVLELTADRCAALAGPWTSKAR